MLLYTAYFCLMCVCEASSDQQLIPYTPSISLSLSLRLQEQLCCSLPWRWPHLWSAGGSSGSGAGNTWPGRDRASRLYSRRVFVCACNSFGDFWRAQLKLREDNGSHTYTHVQRHVLAFPKVKPQGCLGLSMLQYNPQFVCACVCE